jgi:NAD(P)-dependent dehydrogenase (short-subunit alcohol dehydrogenase family)
MKNKTVIVVGGSKGIGKGVVDAFTNLGAIVYSLSRDNCDITSKRDIDEFFDDFGKVDILINNAAINYCKPIEEISLNEWNKVINTNLTSYFYIIKKCLPLMEGGSKIVNVSSIAGRSKSLVSGVHYTSSKAGLIGLTRQLAQELGPKGININCVCPSQTLTPMLERSMTNEQLSELESKIPLRRVAQVSEVVKPILFLCSDDASYIHGACLDINGGQL